MYAAITKDHLVDGEVITENRVGKLFLNSSAPVGILYDWRTLDDDEIVYYEGIADDEALEHVAEWSERDSGTVVLQTFNTVTEEWEDCIA